MSLLKSLATPVAWVLLLMAVGLILTRFGRSKRLCKIGWWSLLVATMILLIFSLEPVANWLVYSLEYRWQSPSPEVLGETRCRRSPWWGAVSIGPSATAA